MENCKFCQIVLGAKPRNVIYQNEHSICFLPKKMEVFGHTLVVPREHFQDLYDIPQDLLGKLTETVQLLTKEFKTRIGATGMNILHASGIDGQQSVLHFHFHLFPRFKNDGLDTWPNLIKKDFNADEICQKLEVTRKIPISKKQL